MKTKEGEVVTSVVKVVNENEEGLIEEEEQPQQ